MMDRRAFLLGLAALPGCTSMAEAAPVPIDEAGWISINGVEQWVAIRGRDVRNPALLFLHGGPGLGIAQSMPLFDAWAEDFTVILWDQPGSGATGARNLGNQGDLSRDRYIRDGLAVAEHARARLGRKTLVLMGISWGTRLGVHMLRERPDMFSAWVGISQAVGRRGDALGQELALAGLRERGNTAGVAALEKLGPPPYRTLEDFLVRQQYTNPPNLPMTDIDRTKTAAMNALLAAAPRNAPYIAYPAWPKGAEPYTLFMSTLRATFPERDFEIRDLGMRWPMPMFVFQGSNDLNTPEPTAREWLAELEAPQKAYAVIDGAGHNTLAFHAELHALLRRHVLPVAS